MNNLESGMNNGLPQWAIVLFCIVLIIVSILFVVALEDSCDGTLVRTITGMYKCIDVK